MSIYWQGFLAGALTVFFTFMLLAAVVTVVLDRWLRIQDEIEP